MQRLSSERSVAYYAHWGRTSSFMVSSKEPMSWPLAGELSVPILMTRVIWSVAIGAVIWSAAIGAQTFSPACEVNALPTRRILRETSWFYYKEAHGSHCSLHESCDYTNTLVKTFDFLFSLLRKERSFICIKIRFVLRSIEIGLDF